jgi:hypothetical protein
MQKDPLAEQHPELYRQNWNAKHPDMQQPAQDASEPRDKEFVGLTDDEIIECANKSWEGLSPHADTLAFARAIEKILQEKNT